MTFLRKRKHQGVNYYSLVEAQRVEGQDNPVQKQIEWLGNYDEAVINIHQSDNIPEFSRQRFLNRLAKLEGVSPVVYAKLYQCIVVTPNWGELEPEEELEAILELPVPKIGDRTECVLWFWFKNEYFSEACKCLEAWEFEVKTILTWVKVNDNVIQAKKSAWLYESTEQCIVAVKGEVTPFIIAKTLTDESTVLLAKNRVSNRKPEEFYELVETLIPEGNKILMLGTTKREGWDIYQ